MIRFTLTQFLLSKGSRVYIGEGYDNGGLGTLQVTAVAPVQVMGDDGGD